MPEHIIVETLSYHYFFSASLFIPPILALICLFFSKNFPYLVRRIKLLTPLYGFLIATSVFVGIILAFLLQSFSLFAMWMSIVSVLLIIGEVKRYKKQRIIASYDIELQKEYVAWAKKKYFFDIVMLLSIFIWVFV